MSAQDVTGKFVGVLIPITIFVASGFEHCIANQVHALVQGQAQGQASAIMQGYQRAQVA